MQGPRSALSDSPDHGDLRRCEGRALTQLGRLERDEGNLPAAVSSAERARKILESLCHDQPEVADHRIDLAGACDELGLTHRRAGRLKEAEASLEVARVILENGTRAARSTSHFGRLGQVYSHLGIVHRTAGRTDLTLALYGGRVRSP